MTEAVGRSYQEIQRDLLKQLEELFVSIADDRYVDRDQVRLVASAQEGRGEFGSTGSNRNLVAV